jgi:hypothetical protein
MWKLALESMKSFERPLNFDLNAAGCVSYGAIERELRGEPKNGRPHAEALHAPSQHEPPRRQSV